MRSTYWNMIPLQPQYVVDLVDNLTGWVEVHALQRLKADKIVDFLFDMMCQFGCIFQLMCDNGTGFKGTVSRITEVELHQNPSYKCINRGLAKWALATLELIHAMRVVIVEVELR